MLRKYKSATQEAMIFDLKPGTKFYVLIIVLRHKITKAHKLILKTYGL